jgi:orotidine-5'-phosphate decarboxylase
MASRSNPVYCAVDTVDLAQAARLIRSVAGGARPAVGGIKLGLEFFLAHGAPGVRYAFPAPVRATGVGFFLDLKLHDIPNTVAGGIRAVVELEPTFVTLHTAGGTAMMKAAAETAAAEARRLGVARPKLLGVTVLTSLDKSDLEATGVSAEPGAQAVRLAALARASGLDGVVCSPHEIAALREACGKEFVLMVPGIRPAGSASGDQKRVMTPRQAVALGANHLVIGRPITEAADPDSAAQAIARDLEAL